MYVPRYRGLHRTFVPRSKVTWTRDGAPLSSTPSMEVKYKNGVASVVIGEVFPEDAGRYACKATNTKGSVETSSKISVLPMVKKSSGKAPAGSVSFASPATNGSVGGAGSVAPRIFKHTASSVVRDGDPVRLECTIAGDFR